MRTLEGHRVNPANDSLSITVIDEPGSGGANHAYVIAGFDPGGNPSQSLPRKHGLKLLFQNGPIAEVGVNGITHEALIAVLIDRLAGFQAGKFSNDFNAKALQHLQAAQDSLLNRTRERMSRGVEGAQKA